ncbi:GDP-mannose mannosyl hydrolase [compost metagenome]
MPGGRVLKNETLEQAFKRLSLQELGVCFSRDDAKLMGVYEHFYSDSTFGETPDTHYVVIGHYLKLSCDVVLDLPKTQHLQFRWCSLAELEVDCRIHECSRAYLSALLKISS